MECDVLVVGAGPTGLTMAAELRRRGVDTMLIDARAEPQQWDRATVVHPRSLEIFEALGIVGRFISAGVPQRAARLHSAGEVLVELDFSLSGAAYPFNLGLSEEDTERFLTEYLEAAGGQVERSTTLLGMTQTADGVTATVERGGREEEVRCAWIVGCGGFHSPVREAIGVELEGHDIADPWAVFDVSLGGRSEDFETTLVYLDHPMTILTPLPGRRFRVYTRPEGDGDFVAGAAAVIADYEPGVELVDVENPARFLCHAKVAARYREGRAFLAGDAAHVCSPDQGHGMNSGIQDAVNLAWKLALVCEGDADPALLDSYEAERRPVALAIVAAGEGMEEMGRFDGPEGRARRDEEVRTALSDPETAHTEAVAEAELNIDYRDSPIVGRREGQSGEDPSLTKGGEVRSGSSPDSLGPGDRLPDLGPVTAAPGEPQQRLDELANRPGHTVLAIAVGDGGDELPRLFAQLEALVARSPLFDAAFALATARGDAPVGTIHPEAAAALGVKSLAVLAIRPDRHIGLFAEGGTLADVERYASVVVQR